MATQTVQKITRKYSDLDLNFIAHPVTKDISTLVNETAVIRSLRNLILTGFYERPFHPEIGSGVKQSLFENATPVTAQVLRQSIQEVITNFEPRVKVKDIIVEMTPDQNQFQVILSFYIQNQTQPTTVTFFLQRAR